MYGNVSIHCSPNYGLVIFLESKTVMQSSGTKPVFSATSGTCTARTVPGLLLRNINTFKHYVHEWQHVSVSCTFQMLLPSF